MQKLSEAELWKESGDVFFGKKSRAFKVCNRNCVIFGSPCICFAHVHLDILRQMIRDVVATSWTSHASSSACLCPLHLIFSVQRLCLSFAHLLILYIELCHFLRVYIHYVNSDNSSFPWSDREAMEKLSMLLDHTLSRSFSEVNMLNDIGGFLVGSSNDRTSASIGRKIITTESWTAIRWIVCLFASLCGFDHHHFSIDVNLSEFNIRGFWYPHP